MLEITSALEASREPDDRPGWSESHRLDCVADRLTLSCQMTVRPNQRQASFLAAVLEADCDPIVIVDHEVPMPGVGWEMRTSGLWAEFVCETPLSHWSYGLEAFALSIDDPDELLGRAIGQRVPLGWEFEFEAGEPAAFFSIGGAVSGSGYSQRGRGHGLLLSADGEREAEGNAIRSHWWGAERPSGFVVGEPKGMTSRCALPEQSWIWQHQRSDGGLVVTCEDASVPTSNREGQT
ncbi:MAG: hypothetical protein ACI8TP_004196 [Acidimicrobiales bacterium]|jgi:hypothetical protein